ncbi:MAG: hypothetical protein ACRC7Q_08920 [Plesiomonas shigelloides]
MKLLELLCEELPNRGGWPEWAAAAVQDGCGKNRVLFTGEGSWGIYCNTGSDFYAPTLASDHATRIVTREEYEAAVTPRVVPRRSDVLASLVGNLKQWPTEITDDLPHFIGWGWEALVSGEVCLYAEEDYIDSRQWELVKRKGTGVLQPQPTPHGSGDPILGMVLADLTNRAVLGKEKYGEPLKAHNGRNALQDAYEEALDMCMYLRQLLEEQRNA